MEIRLPWPLCCSHGSLRCLMLLDELTLPHERDLGEQLSCLRCMLASMQYLLAPLAPSAKQRSRDMCASASGLKYPLAAAVHLGLSA